MEGPSNQSLFSSLAVARVVAYDSANHGVYVQVPSLQTISLPAKVLINGPADATRINQYPLPVIGTWGLIAVPYGDSISAVWLGAFYNSTYNAVTTSNPPTDQDSQMKYFSHASGSWSLLDYIGNYFSRLADGTVIAANNDNKEPATYRHIIDTTTGSTTMVQVTDAFRNQYPSGPFWLSGTHPSSGSATMSPSGMIFVQAGQPLMPSIAMNTSGIIDIWTNGPNAQAGAAGPRISMNSNNGDGGNVIIQTNATNSAGGTGPTVILDATGGTVTINGANSTATIAFDNSGDITIFGNGNITIQSGINVTINVSSGDVAFNTSLYNTTIDDIITIFNTHTHSGVTTGQSNTGLPNSIIP